MKRTVLVSFLAIAALGLLVAFAYNSRSVPVEAHVAQHTILTDLEETQRNFEAMVATLTAAMDAGEAPPAGTLSLQRRLAGGPERIVEELRQIPGSTAELNRIESYQERYAQSSAAADSLIDALISEQTTYAESVDYLREAGPGIIERMRASGLERAAADAFQLIVGAVDYAARDSAAKRKRQLRRVARVHDADALRIKKLLGLIG